MLGLFFLIMVTPILNWFAMKHFAPIKAKKFKRFTLWFVTTWIAELVLFISYLVVA